MKVLFFGSVQKYTSDEESFEADGVTTIRMLLHLLRERYGEGFYKFLMGDKTCVILVNGNSIVSTGGWDTPLLSSDTVDVLPFVDGG